MTDAKTKFVWEGDLEDDCTLRYKDFVGRAECMGSLRLRDDEDDEWFDGEYWWCAVYHGDDQLFHEDEPGGLIIGGDMARAVCEAIIRAACQSREKEETRESK